MILLLRSCFILVSVLISGVLLLPAMCDAFFGAPYTYTEYFRYDDDLVINNKVWTPSDLVFGSGGSFGNDLYVVDPGDPNSPTPQNRGWLWRATDSNSDGDCLDVGEGTVLFRGPGDFERPTGLAFGRNVGNDFDNDLFVIDDGPNRVYRITDNDGLPLTISNFTSGTLITPQRGVFSNDGNHLFVVDSWVYGSSLDGRIFSVDPTSGISTFLAAGANADLYDCSFAKITSDGWVTTQQGKPGDTSTQLIQFNEDDSGDSRILLNKDEGLWVYAFAFDSTDRLFIATKGAAATDRNIVLLVDGNSDGDFQDSGERTTIVTMSEFASGGGICSMAFNEDGDLFLGTFLPNGSARTGVVYKITGNGTTTRDSSVNIESGDDTNDGSALHPWKTLHHAITQINSWGSGTYTLNVAPGGSTIDRYSLAHGEANSELIISQDSVTIVAQTGTVPIVEGSDDSLWADGFKITGSNVTISGLNITGFAGGNRTGIDIIAGSSNTIENCQINGNDDGISVWQSDHCTIQGCEIDNNNFDGISISESANSIITRNSIHDNYEVNNSDGIIVQACSPEISRNTIYDNRFNISIQAGSGETTSPTIKNNLIYQVTSGKVHFGILMGGAGTANPTIYHNTVDGGLYDGIYMDGVGNAPEIKYNIITGFGQFGVENYNGVGNPLIDYNDVWNNASGTYDNCVNPPLGGNNISADPQYTSYTLAVTSPCINAIPTGNPPNDPVTMDFDGESQPYGSGFDMGAYENQNLPAVTTTTVSSIATNSASSGGTVTSSGSETSITARGVCWSTSANPTIALTTKTTDGSGLGTFTSSITGLAPNTTYHVRAYATNGESVTGYGSDLTFTTSSATTPIVTTTAASSITTTTASSGGNITSDGGASVTARGVCWSTSANPTISDSHTTDGTGLGTFTSNITGLAPNTTYHVRAYATNGESVTGYGSDLTFTTSSATTPIVTTTAASSVTATTASSGGNVTSDGGASVTARGVCWSTSADPSVSNDHTLDGSGSGAFNSNITGLVAATTYYVRAYATNNAGTAYGTVKTFTTSAAVFGWVGVYSSMVAYDQTDFPGQTTNPKMAAFVYVPDDIPTDPVTMDSTPTGDGVPLTWNSGWKAWIAQFTSPPIGSAWQTFYTFHMGVESKSLDISDCTIRELSIPQATISSDGRTISWNPVEYASFYRLYWFPIKDGLPDTSGGFLATTGNISSTTITVPYSTSPGTYAVKIEARGYCSGQLVNISTLWKKDIIIDLAAGTYYVNIASGNDANDGSAAHPWKTLHYAISQINGGNVGTYVLHVALETYNVANGEANSQMVLGQSNVTIKGESGSAPIIDGRNAQNWTKGIEITGSNVIIENLYITGFYDTDEEGIRISGGTGNEIRYCNSYQNNWGIRVYKADTTTIRNCEVFENATHGIDIVQSTETAVLRNKIHGNLQYGIRVQSSSEISRNEIYDNIHGILIEAINSDSASPVIKNNVIYKTATGAMATGIHTRADNESTVNPEIYHNTIDGGTLNGITMEKDGTSSSAPIVKYNNITNFGQYGIQNAGANPAIDYNDVWNNTADNYNGCTAGANDISLDPKYASYSLQADSPCINNIPSTEGDPVTVDYPGFERPRPDSTAKDMGAYENIAKETNNYTLPGGTGLATDYRIFTVPLSLGTGADMLKAMENVLGTYDPVHWRAFLYSGTSYIEFNSSQFASYTIKPGMGFWIITTYTDVVPFNAKPAPDGVDYVMELSSGWHLIGLPWTDTNILLSSIKVTDGVNTYAISSPSNNLTQRQLWDYTGVDGYVARTAASFRLRDNKGYFFKVNDNPIRMIIPNAANLAHEPPPDVFPNQTPANDDDEAPPPPPGAEPSPDIKANGQDGPVVVNAGDPVSISVSLDPGAWSGRNADWWVAARTPFDPPLNWYTYVYPEGWRYGIHVCAQTPLYELTPPFKVLNTVLPAGNYIFYFAVDGNMDGETDATWLDYVEVDVK